MNPIVRISGAGGYTPRLLIFALVAMLGAACSDDGASDASDDSSGDPVVPAENRVVGEALPTPPVETVTSGPASSASDGPPSAETASPVETAPETPEAAGEATQHVILGVVTQWRPMILFAEPGDQIVFRQMTGHDTESMEGLTPDGSVPWKSKLGEEGFSITLETPGAYIYKCNPHVSTGMVGAIVVGPVPPANLEALAQNPQNKGMIGRAIRKLNQALDAR